MLELIKNIEGNFITNVIGGVNSYHSIHAEIQKEDFIQIYGFTGLLQNLSKIEDTFSYGLPALFGFSIPATSPMVSLDFSTCNKKASWYNMQESPDYMMGVFCGSYPSSGTVTISINSFIVNGVEHITTPKQVAIRVSTINWIPAKNDIVYDCLYGNPTGFTYSEFVDFLNKTFLELGLNNRYNARLSYVEKNLGNHNSKNGFYLIYPEDDEFYLSTSSDSGFPYLNLIYANSQLLGPGAYEYYKMTNDVTYYCDIDTIVE